MELVGCVVRRLPDRLGHIQGLRGRLRTGKCLEDRAGEVRIGVRDEAIHAPGPVLGEARGRAVAGFDQLEQKADAKENTDAH